MIVNPDLYEKYRVVINREKFLRVEGVLQNQDHTISIKASRVLPFRLLQPKRNPMISTSYGAYFRFPRYSDTISPARMVITEIMWVHYRRYCWSLTAPSSRIAAIR